MEFKINFEHNFLSLVMGSELFKDRWKLKLTEKREQRSRDSSGQMLKNCPILLVSTIYHDWENMKIKEFDFSLTEEIQINFWTWCLALSNVRHVIIARSKGQLSKIMRAIIAPLNWIWVVWAPVRVITRHSWPDPVINIEWVRLSP